MSARQSKHGIIPRCKLKEREKIYEFKKLTFENQIIRLKVNVIFHFCVQNLYKKITFK